MSNLQIFYNQNPCINILCTPCCKDGRIHRECIQKSALAARSHDLRCPLCNNVDQYQKACDVMAFISQSGMQPGSVTENLLNRINTVTMDVMPVPAEISTKRTVAELYKNESLQCCCCQYANHLCEKSFETLVYHRPTCRLVEV